MQSNPNASSSDSLLANLKWDRESGIQRQITTHLRRLIRSRELPEGTRVPSIQFLAHLWGTNHFTVQKAMRPLVEEGLLDRQPRVGTRVRRPPPTKCFGMYLGHRIFTDQGRFFYMALYVALHTVMAEAGYQLRLWVDSRPVKEHRTPPRDLMDTIARREILGLIAPGVRSEEFPWIKKLPITVVGFGSQGGASFANTITFDYAGMFSFFFTQLKKAGCHSAGLITPLRDVTEIFQSMAAENGMQTRREWIPSHPKIHLNQDFGAAAMRDLLKLRTRPKALVIYPDNVVQGTLHEMWNSGLRIPSDLRLCLHRNHGIEFFCPYPAIWAETSLIKIAKAFFKVLRSINDGEEPILPVVVPFDLKA